MKCHTEIKEREDEMAQGGKAPRRLACGIWGEGVTLGDITEFETDQGILVIENLSKFEPLIFEQSDEVTIGHLDFG
jgi:hypothetical protein